MPTSSYYLLNFDICIDDEKNELMQKIMFIFFSFLFLFFLMMVSNIIRTSFFSRLYFFLEIWPVIQIQSFQGSQFPVAGINFLKFTKLIRISNKYKIEKIFEIR